MSHPRPQARSLNPSSTGSTQSYNPSNPFSSLNIMSAHSNSHRQYGLQRPNNGHVIPSPVSSQRPDDDDDLYDNPDKVRNQENNPEIEGTSKSTKRGLEMLRDALEEVLNKRQRRWGINYVLLYAWISTYCH
jgi:hypothetical protein